MTRRQTLSKEEHSILDNKVLFTIMENISDDDKMQIGINLFNEGKYFESIEYFSVLTERGNISAQQYLARCYYRLESYESAYKHYLYLSEHSEGMMRDYYISMLATIEMMYGNINQAIKMLTSLPTNDTNLISTSIMYWQKGISENDERAIFQAMDILKKVNVDSLNLRNLQIYYHIKALLHQAQKDLKIAVSFYTKALALTSSDVDRGKVLNDLASLYITCNRYDDANQTLEEAKKLVTGKSKLEEALNYKWSGLLQMKLKNYKIAKEYLKKAVEILKEKKLVCELAGVAFLVADLVRKERGRFYDAANHYAEGIIYEKLGEDLKDRDEKVLDFFFNAFLGHSDLPETK